MEYHEEKPSKISNSNRPFFIFSCPRSGSSLLSRMLDQHPKLAVPYESHLFNTFYPWLKYYGDLWVPENRAKLMNDILSTDVLHDWSPPVNKNRALSLISAFDFGGVVDAILYSWTAQQGKLRWGEKTPHHVYYGSEIKNFFPNAQFIHIVRDGRDVATSWIRSRFGPKNIYSAARQWVAYLNEVEAFKRLVSPELMYEVHYEDLVKEPEKNLIEICDFLQEPFSANMLAFHKKRITYQTDETNKANLKKPIMENNTGKWKKQMSKTDLRTFEAVAQTKLVAYGYEPAVNNPCLTQTEQFYYKYIESPTRKFCAMARNHKGHVDALIRMNLLLRLLSWYWLRRRVITF